MPTIVTLLIVGVALLPKFLTLELQTCKNVKSGNHLCKKNDQPYDKTKIPGELPLILHPVLDIYDVLDVDEEKNLITIYIQISIGWIDPGLSYHNNSM